jgi:NAD(P)-dependent dehydrogenase (short-subunit alcohol dehydrogenase family)
MTNDARPGRLDGRRILVTGAGRGIGRAVALVFASEGASLGLIDLERPGLTEVAGELEAVGARVEHRAVDVTDHPATRQAVQEIGEGLGGLDGVVVVAGITRPDRSESMSPETWQRVIDVNLGGAFFAIQAALPFIHRAGRGSIVAIGSIAAYGGPIGRANYAASKAGIVGLIRNLALELGPDAIRCNVVAPGHINAPMGARDPAQMESSASRTPLRRLGEPEDVARACLFLISDESDFVTGQVLNVCGGRTLFQSDAPFPLTPAAPA